MIFLKLILRGNILHKRKRVVLSKESRRVQVGLVKVSLIILLFVQLRLFTPYSLVK